jgi:hypothetical protein
MPAVPQQDAPTVGINSGALPLLNPNKVEGSSLLGVASEALGAGAKTAAGIAGLVEARAHTLQQLNNKAASDNAFVDFTQKANEVAVAFTTNARGGQAVEKLGPTVQELEAQRKEISASLGNAVAQDMFNSASRRQLASITGEMSRHAASEQRAYVKGSSTAKIDAATDTAATHYADETLRTQAMMTIAQEVTFQGKMDGLSDEQIAENTRKVQSDAWKSILTRMATDDPVGAKDLFLENAGNMTAADQGMMARYLKSAAQPVEAAGLADAIVGEYSTRGSPPNPTVTAAMEKDPSKFFSTLAGGQIVITSAKRTPEENVKAGGSPTSEHLSGTAWDIRPPKGMSTADLANRLAASGVAFDQIIDEGDHVHFGLGPKMRNQILKKSGGKFISLGQGGSPPTTAKDLETHLPAMIETARAEAERLHPEDPSFADLAEQRVVSQVRRMTAAENLSTSQSQDNLLLAMLGGPNGDQARPTDVEGLLKSYPGAQADWMKLDAKQKSQMLSGLISNAYVTPKEATPQMYDKYYELKGMLFSDPGTFASQDIMGMNIPQTWKSQLVTEQLKIRAGQTAKSGLEPAMKVANSYLIEAGINQSADIKSYNKFKGQLQDGLETFSTIYGRKPTEKEIITITNNLLIKNKGHRLYQAPSPVGVVVGVPNVIARDIVTRARARGYTGPISADQIRQAYNMSKGE